jgi:DNA-binding beta-propeller fold protein YncE
MRHMRGLIRAASVPVAIGCAAAFLVTASGAPASGSVSRSAGGGPAGTSVALSGIAGGPVANPRTDTVYVPVQSGHVVDVINAATCNAIIRSGCRVVARASVGSSPLAAAVDEATDTLYVLNGPGTVSVVDGAGCNARVTRACGRPLATIKVGALPVAAAINPATRTLYVANLNGGSVSVINAATCNALTTRGCGQHARTIKDTAGPDGIDVDVATDTVYAANSGTANPPAGDTVSVINGATCNGHTGGGCGQTPRAIKVGSGAFWVAVDQASDTVYVPNNNDGTVSVIDGARCNAVVAAGCASTPPAVTTGAQPQFVAVDNGLHTVFAINQGDGTLSAINIRTCNGAVTSGCATVPPSERATFPRVPGGNPNAFALIPRTNTAYLVNAGGADILSVISVGGCNATRTAACRRPAPSVPNHEFLISVDPATDTLYAGNLSQPVIDVLNGATCNTRDRSGCAPVAEIPMTDPDANVGAIDDTTHTLYASNPFPSSDTVAVINTATCNARHTSGCADRPPVIKVGPAPGPPALNPRTRTLYIPFGTAADRVAVVKAATCNAEHISGCMQSPAVVKVGQGTFALAVSTATDTVYGQNAGTPASGFTNGDTVSVINGATCNGTNHSGCGRLAATAKVGHQPIAIAINDRTNTIYVTNFASGDLPGTVSVISGAACNGTHITGCSRRVPAVTTGLGPYGIAVDSRTGGVYVADYFSAAVTVLDGSRCNASVTTGCHAAAREQAVGSSPDSVAIDPDTNTVYVPQVFQSGSMSIFAAAH